MMNTEQHLSLAELARVAGITPRTVRYYIAQGLLPGPNDAGPGAWYDARHLSRLQLIRDLQREHLPLAEIRARLAQLSEAEIEELAGSRAAQPEPPASSALDYIRSVLGGGTAASTPQASKGFTAPPPAPRLPAAVRLARTEMTPPPALAVGSILDLGPSLADDSNAPDAPATSPAAPTAARSQWDRIALTNDIELHVRRPLSRQDNRRVERLITIARQVLGEEQP